MGGTGVVLYSSSMWVAREIRFLCGVLFIRISRFLVGCPKRDPSLQNYPAACKDFDNGLLCSLRAVPLVHRWQKCEEH